MRQVIFSRVTYDRYARELERFEAEAIKKSELEFEEASGGESSVWHDNFEHDEAHRAYERRAKQIQSRQMILQNAVVIEIKEQNDKVMIGNTVVFLIENQRGVEEKREVTIGAYEESDPSKGLISYLSPLAQALMECQKGDDSIFNTRDIFIEEIYPPSYKYHLLMKELQEELQDEDRFES